MFVATQFAHALLVVRSTMCSYRRSCWGRKRQCAKTSGPYCGQSPVAPSALSPARKALPVQLRQSHAVQMVDGLSPVDVSVVWSRRLQEPSAGRWRMCCCSWHCELLMPTCCFCKRLSAAARLECSRPSRASCHHIASPCCCGCQSWVVIRYTLGRSQVFRKTHMPGDPLFVRNVLPYTQRWCLPHAGPCQTPPPPTSNVAWGAACSATPSVAVGFNCQGSCVSGTGAYTATCIGYAGWLVRGSCRR